MMTPPGRALLIPPISSAAPGALYQQIVDGLKREISEGRLAPGAPLPSVRAFAADLLVSVITVTRAYEDLERDGLVYRRQGLGTFVSEGAASRSRVVKIDRARALLREAIHEARESGLRPRDITRLFTDILDQEAGARHVRSRG